MQSIKQAASEFLANKRVAVTGVSRITVIDGGCPLMFAPTSDFGHRVLRVVLAGRVPKQV